MKKLKKRSDQGLDISTFVERITGYPFYNTSPLDFSRLVAAPDEIKDNLKKYIAGFSPNIRDIFVRFNFDAQIDTLSKAGLLYKVIQKFAVEDLHPKIVSNHDMGLAFEDLIRQFSELSNETAGEHFTPREVIRLMVNLLFNPDSDVLNGKGVIRTIYDPAAGTGGMLSGAEEFLYQFNPDAQLIVAGQELNDESFAICKADMLIKGQDTSKIIPGNTLSNDGHKEAHFDYGLSNPPFGVEWKKVQDEVTREFRYQGFNGRFGPGLPRISDGSLLFLLHLISKMPPTSEGGGRIAIVLNGSPLFTGSAGSGESEIRKWVIENDLLEAIVALPTDMFYNTGIATYIWVLSNHKPKARTGKIQLINAVDFFQKMRKSLGSKRKELGEADIDLIVRLYGDFKENEHNKIFSNIEFGYSTITIERPLRLRFEITAEQLSEIESQEPWRKVIPKHTLLDIAKNLESRKVWMDRAEFLKDVNAVAQKLRLKPTASGLGVFCSTFGERNANAAICLKKDEPEPDPELRDTENVPLNEDIEGYFQREVIPHAPDAWIDHTKTKVGYEVPFTRHFYKFTPPRPLEEIDAELKAVTDEILALLKAVID